MLNNELSNEPTYEDLEKLGIDTSTIKVCKTLRNLAKLNRVKLDESEHRSGLNKHLFDYIKYCGKNVLDFVKEYLSHLQPYMIERRLDQEKKEHLYCVIDNLYRVSVYIKVYNEQFKEVIVSFHEDNKNGIARANDKIILKTPARVPIFADSISGQVSNSNKFTINTIFQRGLLQLPLTLSGYKCRDIFIVERRVIDTNLIDYCNEYISDLYMSDYMSDKSLDLNKIKIFTRLQQISFTSYGKDVFSSISILIDSLNVQPDVNSKSVADFALITFVQNIKLTVEQQEELKELLLTKYAVSADRKTEPLLNRVFENLALLYNEEQRELEIEANYVNSLVTGKIQLPSADLKE